MHEVLVNRLGGLRLPRKRVVRLTDRPYMTLVIYRGRKQQHNNNNSLKALAYMDKNLSTQKKLNLLTDLSEIEIQHC